MQRIKEHTDEEGLSFFFFLNAILLDFVLGLGDGEICCAISPLPSFDLKSEKEKKTEIKLLVSRIINKKSLSVFKLKKNVNDVLL